MSAPASPVRAYKKSLPKKQYNIVFSEAISEAYYAMFHAAKALLALRGIYPKTHAGVVSQFGLQFVTEGLIEELYAKSLAKAETKREKADYDLYFEPSEEEAEDIVEDAKKFLVRIKEAIKEIHDKSLNHRVE